MKCEYGCNQEALFKMSNGKMCCSKSYNQCPEVRSRNSEALKRAHKEGRMRNFSIEDRQKGNKEMRKKLKLVYNNLPFKEKPLSEQLKIVLDEQNGKCLICGIDSWNDKPLKLHLDHIDGNNQNNSRENLRYVCPNCHSQTETYCGRNINSGNKKVSDQELADALFEFPNIRQALKSVGLSAKGGNYNRAKKLKDAIQVIKESYIY